VAKSVRQTLLFLNTLGVFVAFRVSLSRFVGIVVIVGATL